MKKKLVTLLLSLCCLCGAAGLNACGGGEENSSQSSAQSGESSTSTSVDEENSSQDSSVSEEPPAPATEGLAYELSDDETYYIVAGIGTATDTDLVIPATHNELPVKAIGYGAFEENETITSVYIGKDITYIDEGAFFACSSLTNVSIGSGVALVDEAALYYCKSLESISVHPNNAAYKSIDGNLYTKDGKILLQYATGKQATEFVIPEGVVCIKMESFAECVSLTNVTIPDTVTTIEGDAFDGCDNLIQKESGVSYVDKWAIKGDSSLTNVVLRENTRGIAENAFASRSDLTEVVVPDSVAFIGVQAFISCNALTRITLGKGVASIGDYAFAYCDNLTAVTFENTSGWTVDGTALSSDDLADTQKAAEYLTDTYYEKLWTRVDE